MESTLTPPASPIFHDADPLRACVHCGLCLEECPTYRLTGDENNSPRGRLLLWRAEADGRLPPDPWTDFYTDECVGCLACASACPANVPYAHLLEEARKTRLAQGRTRVHWQVALAGKAVQQPKLFNLALAPARMLRRANLLPHPMVFPGSPALAKSTAAYASELMDRRQPTGPVVALLTGCLMEALFREINFATVRVLIENNVQVLVPEGQGCCGAFHEHTGMPGVDAFAAQNRAAFSAVKVDRVVSNSAGCGLALAKALTGVARVQDVLGFLGEIGAKPRPKHTGATRVYVDLPCHLVHGQRTTIPTAVLDATGYPWEFAPKARDCCGSGGVYNIQKPDNARAILREKASFFDELPAEVSPVLATANHVCMMQWQTARRFVQRPFQVRHVIQLLDPEADLAD
jgi:glycolate oxidase iron-sulfur subunit